MFVFPVMNPENLVIWQTKEKLKNLSNQELTRLYLKLNIGSDVTNDPAFHKIKDLFTLDNGKKCHHLVKVGFDCAISERLPELSHN